MEIPIEYNLAGKSWEKKEDDQLIKEYNIDRLNLLDICKIHKRMPGGIVSRLKRLNLVDINYKIRGYKDYQHSDIYKKICKYRAENKLDIKAENKNVCLISEDNTDIILNNIDDMYRPTARLYRKQMSSDIIQLKKDVKEIKESVSKILELMNAVYEFENS